MDLTGKWRYIENYGYGVAEGELYLKQKGQTLAGRIVFTDKVEDRDRCAAQKATGYRYRIATPFDREQQRFFLRMVG